MSETKSLLLTEIEVAKLSLKPGDVLGVKITADDVHPSALNLLKEQLSDLFPNNQVMVFALHPGDNIEFTAIQSPPAMSCSSSPTSYCSDCSCGKREQVESEKQGE